jgi:metallo-beta-lactamase family protein
MSKTLDLICYSGVGQVTGANFMLSGEPGKMLIDCGLVQGSKFAPEENQKSFGYDPASVGVLVITHAHMDHIGRIPKLVHDGFRGVIYSSSETRELAPLMFNDALGIFAQEEKKYGRKPLYTLADVDQTLSLWQSLHYHEAVEALPGVTVTLKDAGHILGSAMVEVRYGDSKMVFTGDLGNSPSLLIRDTEWVEDANYILMESVYGDRNHETKEERDREFAEVVKDTIARGGAVVIPAFSLERTQDILYTLNNLIEEKRMPSVPVFVDSPLAIKVTEVFKQSIRAFKSSIQQEIKGGDDIFNFPKLEFTLSTGDSEVIKHTKNPKIILAGSGMSAGGRVTTHEATYLPDPKSTILLAGYQAVGTVGRLLEEGIKKVMIHDQEVEVKARIVNIRGFSSHKDSDHLVEFIEKAAASKVLKKVFVTMGEPKASLFLTQRLRDSVGVDAVVPPLGEPVKLSF